MLKTLAVGYGSAVFLALLGVAFVGAALAWALFVWLAGAPLTLVAAGLFGSQNTSMDRRPLRRKSASGISIAR